MVRIGKVEIAPPVALAPMEDVTNIAMRTIAKRIGGPGLMFTEFVSAMAVHYKAKKTFRKMLVGAAERPLGIQIFGGDPDVMAETAMKAEEMGADILDINMGCWVPKVCRTGSGAALLKDPALATEIVSRVVRAVSIPVTVKVRAGWDYSLFAAPDLAKAFVGVGAKAITLHARFAKQGFEGEADWRLIGALRQAIDVPLFGNGDIKTAADARRMMNSTGCDGVMVGRAAISNPWALQRIVAEFTDAKPLEQPSLSDRIDVALEHLRLAIDFERETSDDDDWELRACRSLRGQIPLYIKSSYGASHIRGALTKCNSYAEFEEILRTFETQIIHHAETNQLAHSP